MTHILAREPRSLRDIPFWMHRLVLRILRFIYARYAIASAIALGLDLSIFLVGFQLGVDAVMASALGYGAGIFAHWMISSRTVFHHRTIIGGRGRALQKAMFVGSALAGLALTVAIVGLGEHWGFDPRLAKLVAVVIAFQLTFLLRSRVVFR